MSPRPSFVVTGLAVAVAGGCLSSNLISYAVPPQEFTLPQNGSFGSGSGNFPSVACTDNSGCTNAQLQAQLPTGFALTCDGTAKKCMASYDVHLVQTINLSQQSGFPSS